MMTQKADIVAEMTGEEDSCTFDRASSLQMSLSQLIMLNRTAESTNPASF